MRLGVWLWERKHRLSANRLKRLHAHQAALVRLLPADYVPPEPQFIDWEELGWLNDAGPDDRARTASAD